MSKLAVRSIVFGAPLLLAATSLSTPVLAQSVTQTFDLPATSGSYTVPAGVTRITITAQGASGGNRPGAPGGGGATVSGTFTVAPGDVIRFVVGEKGQSGGSFDAGGGGSTGVFINNTLVMVAGGGGGSDNTGGLAVGGRAGEAGSGTGAGSGCSARPGVSGGAGGLGGGLVPAGCNGGNNGGSGGGGINAPGQVGGGGAGGGGSADLNPADGLTVAPGGAAATRTEASIGNARGGAGFTGGGGSQARESGGGGGYSGGAGGNPSSKPGGGGSFLSSILLVTGTGSTTAGPDATDTGDGSVAIVTPVPDLVTVKTLASGDATPAEGDTVTFQITVSNNGASGAAATNVSLTDVLPAGLTATANNGTVTRGSYDAGTGLWTIGTLGNGETVELTIEGVVDFGQAGQTIENVIPSAAAGDQADPSSAGDDLSESVVVDTVTPLGFDGATGTSGGNPAYDFAYDENRSDADTLGSVTATGGDGNYTYSISGGNVDGFYEIDPSTGAITLTPAGVASAANDFEAPDNSRTIQVTVTDLGGRTASIDVILTEQDLDDTAPVLAANQELDYPEGQNAGDTLGMVSASDATGVTSFRFADTGSQTSADGFYTIDDSGNIALTAAGAAANASTNDFETGPNSFSYDIEALDAAGNVSAPVSVTLNVTDQDDTAPVIAPAQEFDYLEAQVAGDTLGMVSAADATGVTSFRFADTGTQTSADGFYTIDDTGNIALTAAGAAAAAATNDFETGPNSFVYDIEALDAAGNISAPVAVTLNVTDQDDTAPVVAADQEFGYVEGRSAGDSLGTVNATDATGVASFRFADTGTQTSADGFYTIDDGGTLALTAAGAAANAATNDFETGPNSFSYDVEALDAAGNVSAPVAVTLNVTDEDDAAPVIAANQEFDYVEGRAAGDTLGTVGAADNLGVTGFRFADTGTQTSADGFYTIDDSGNIALTAAGAASNAATNDFETGANTFAYDIEALDSAGNVSSPVSVTLNITDRDDTAPVIAANQQFDYVEGQAAGDTLGTVGAADNVAVTGFRFADTGTQTSADGFYAIDDSGAITLTAAGAAADVPTNDFETGANTFTYEIEALDGQGNVSAPVAVTLNVTDRDDSGPIIGDGNGTSAVSVNEGTLSVVTLTADEMVTWSISGGPDAGDLVVDPDTGELSFAEAPDFEAPADSDGDNVYIVVVAATDSDGNTTNETVTVTVRDLDDTAPTIAQTPDPDSGRAQFSVDEGTQGVTSFAADETVTWTIDGIDAPDFEIDPATGSLTFTGIPDFEMPDDENTDNQYLLTVTATDTAGNSTALDVLVEVLDIDDTGPVIIGPSGAPGAGSSQVSVNEGLVPVTAFAADEDVIWSIAGGNDAGRLDIDPDTGQLAFIIDSDFENPVDSDGDNRYEVIVRATDPVGSFSEQAVTVIVLDIDEVAAKLDEIGDQLRGDLRSYAQRGLADMLAFNEQLLAGGPADFCERSGERRPFGGSLTANERSQQGALEYDRIRQDCARGYRFRIHGGAIVSGYDGEWGVRGIASAQVEFRLDDDLTAGIGVMGSFADDELSSFDASSISDTSVQLNGYLHARLSDNLRAAGFAAIGKSWYDFFLVESDGFTLDGNMTGTRYAVGGMLSGDIFVDERFTITPDVALSWAREDLGNAKLDAIFRGETRNDILFSIGSIDTTRISVPVRLRYELGDIGHPLGLSREISVSPGLLCEERGIEGGGLQCGYQIGGRLAFEFDPRSFGYGDYRFEKVDDFKRHLVVVGLGYRFGDRDQYEVSLEGNQGIGVAGQNDTRALVSLKVIP